MAKKRYRSTSSRKRDTTLNTFKTTVMIIGIVILAVIGYAITTHLLNIANKLFVLIAIYSPFIFIGICGMAIAAFSMGIWFIVDKRKESWRRAVNGSYPLLATKVNGQKVLIDPNKLANGVNNLEVMFHQLSFTSEQQLIYNQSIQTTRSIAAISSENGNRISATFGKLIGGYYNRPTYYVTDNREEDAIDTEPKDTELITVYDAIEQSKVDNWIIGQNKVTGDLYSFNPFDIVHFGIVGATGTGKTACVALLLMIYAIKFRFRVIIWDGKGGNDWSNFKNSIEYYTLDYTNIDYYLQQIEVIYQERQSLLNQYNINSILHLPREARNIALAPMFIIIDEFGAVMDGLKLADKELYKAVSSRLGNLLRLSRSTGLIFIFCDQDPTKWPSTMKANLSTNICFRLGGRVGSGINEYNLDKLDRKGHFQVDGSQYHAWKTYEVIDDVLTGMRDNRHRKPMLLPYNSSASQADTPIQSNDTNEYTDNDIYTSTCSSNTMIQLDAPRYNLTQIDVQHDTKLCNPLQTDTQSDASRYRLSGKPETKEEKDIVYLAYMRNNKNVLKTCEELWGSRTVSRSRWIKEVMTEYR